MSTMLSEVEACLAFIGAERARLFERLASASELVGLEVEGREHAELVDRYFDTAQRDLARADMALRWRRRRRGVEQRELLTWKGPAERVGESGVSRAELEGPASEELLRGLLGHARTVGLELASSAACGEADPERWLAAAGLECVQERVTERTSALLLGPGGEPLCELALDLVRYRAGERTVLHRELELEARGATTFAELEALAAELAAAHSGELRPWPWSKTALGVALDGLEATGELEELVSDECLSPLGYDRVTARLGA